MLRFERVFVDKDLVIDESVDKEYISLDIENIKSLEALEAVTLSGEKKSITRIHVNDKIFPDYVNATIVEVMKRIVSEK